MEPTSEQELRQLLDEGRITEEEYKELLEAIRQKETVQKPLEKPIESTSNSVNKLGKIALILVLGGIALFAFAIWSSHSYRHPADPNLRRGVGGFNILLFGGMELAGLVTGIIAWKSSFGKAAAITVGLLLLLSALLIA